MARRAGVRSTIAPAPSPALVLAILIGLAAPPAGALAKHAEPATQTAAPGAGDSPAEARAERAAQRRAERLARHAERTPAGNAGTSEEAAGASTPDKSRGGASERAARRAERAAERAQRAAERAARRSGGNGAAGTHNASLPAAAQGGSSTDREERRRAREERKRLREEERRRSGHETKKERAAREARESSERAAAAGAAAAAAKAQQAAAPLFSAGLAPVTTPQAKTGLGAPASIVREHGARATRSHRPAGRHGRGGTANATALAGGGLPAAVAASGSAAAGVAGQAAARARRDPTRAHRSSPKPSSPLVTTVTRIIGVIPAALWLLIGALALAALAFATTSRLAARRVGRLDRQRRELLEDVGLLQAALLPELPDRLGAVTTSAAYRPASGPGAGGDFYDVFALPEGLVGLLVGDVSGHGRDALPHTTLLRYTLRAYLEAGLSPREAVRAAAPALERQLGGSFATVVLASYDPRARLLTYSCAGHPHPLLTGLDPDETIIAASAPPIGAGRPTGTRQTIVSVPGAAVIAFFTDGVIEARTGAELFGERRLSRALGELARAARTPDAASLLDRVAELTERRPDDMAACLLGVVGDERPPLIVCEQIVLDGRESELARARRFLTAVGVTEREIDGALRGARTIAADHGTALVELRLGEGAPRLTLTHDNVAPLRARALARTQEVVL